MVRRNNLQKAITAYRLNQGGQNTMLSLNEPIGMYPPNGIAIPMNPGTNNGAYQPYAKPMIWISTSATAYYRTLPIIRLINHLNVEWEWEGAVWWHCQMVCPRLKSWKTHCFMPTFIGAVDLVIVLPSIEALNQPILCWLPLRECWLPTAKHAKDYLPEQCPFVVELCQHPQVRRYLHWVFHQVLFRRQSVKPGRPTTWLQVRNIVILFLLNQVAKLFGRFSRSFRCYCRWLSHGIL